MTRPKVQFQCSECGSVALKWSGKCTSCQSWNSMFERVVDTATEKVSNFREHVASTVEVYTLDTVNAASEPRRLIGIAELDRVLGGGLVTGSVVLLGGDPGIGKSTLLLQVLAKFSMEVGKGAGLYVTAEESAQQVGLRAQRLSLDLSTLLLLTENQLERIFAAVAQQQSQLIVIDSIQTVYSEYIQSAPGAVGQVRECTARLVRLAKQTNTTVFLIGHVTKEGALAGPRALEHMVDTVLYFEGDSNSRYRVLRAAKNRFGALNELGFFAMMSKGLRGVSNPSAILLSRRDKPIPGSVVMVMREGTRPILVEVQALVDTACLSSPNRVTVGLDQRRLTMLLAILHRHTGVTTTNQDVYVNIVGGIRVVETGADLAILLAIVSSLHDRDLAMDLAVFGELGLSGEIRPVQDGVARLYEAAKHGFRHAIIPLANKPKNGIDGLDIIAVEDLQQALTAANSLSGST